MRIKTAFLSSSFILHPSSLNLLKANKSPWFETLFAVYNRNLFGRRFGALRVEGIENLRNRKTDLPLVLYANHSSWWDGLVAFEIGRVAGLDQFLMMEEKQLKQLFLFRRLGAFSVVRENPRMALLSINYAVDVLKEKPNRGVWIFPQGEILPNDARPLRFYQGLARIIEKTGRCTAAAVAMRYEFLGEFKPTAFAKISNVEILANVEEPKQLTEQLSLRLTALLDELKADIAAEKTSEYVDLLKKNAAN
ncbi:MAG: lysophospholipid acyltransferase family protein [Acidobacteriota bacterium]|nr:lysophospholipid acyltransferase family protein [Acidobacteriota bacterium]